jgi:hypothetical protein
VDKATETALSDQEETLSPTDEGVLIDPKVDWEDAAPHPAVSLRDREKPASMSTTITPAGGYFGFGRIILQFEAGALVEDTVVSIVLQKEAKGEVYFDLLPHDLELPSQDLDLQAPVTLIVNMWSMANPEDSVRLSVWDDEAQRWMDVSGSWEYPKMTTTLNSFSRFRCSVAMSAESPAVSIE